MVYNYKRLNDNTHIDGYTIPSKDVLINSESSCDMDKLHKSTLQYSTV